jgi:di/tricarboxylate transporter
VHTAFYLAAGLAAVVVTRMADRVPATVTGLVIVMITVEFGFLELSTQTLAQQRIDELTWRGLLVAHAAADVVFALLLLRAHPSLRRDLVKGYEG